MDPKLNPNGSDESARYFTKNIDVGGEVGYLSGALRINLLVLRALQSLHSSDYQ
jgi:hypothetical protein